MTGPPLVDVPDAPANGRGRSPSWPVSGRPHHGAPPGEAVSGVSSGGGRPARHRRSPQRLRAVAVAVTSFGVVVALLAAYLFGFTWWQQSRAQHRLLAGLTGPAGLTALSGRIPPPGHPIALLKVPALHLRQVVVAGTTAADLALGPGLMPGSAPPGVAGNTVIAGHRLLFGHPFADVGTLRRGATITLVGGLGVFTYRVTSTGVIQPGGPDPVVPTSDSRLTLVTSDGSLTPTDRDMVVAAMTSRPADVKVAMIDVPPPPALALSGDGKALVPTIVWGLALLLGLAGTFTLYRRWCRPWPTYLMTTPVLLVLAVLCFQSLALLLPATM